jgi:hypothetical protein
MVDKEWMPSLPFPITDREKKELRAQEREKNRIKNERRRQAKENAKKNSKQHVEAGKQLRRAFGGAFGRSRRESVKWMASQGTSMEIEKKPRGKKSEEDA